MANRYSLALAGCCMVLFAGACRDKEQPKENVRVYPFHGLVVRLDPATSTAAIHNDKVEGWMDPMTMEYPIANKDEFKSLRVDERISAQISVTSDGYTLSNIHEETAK